MGTNVDEFVVFTTARRKDGLPRSVLVTLHRNGGCTTADIYQRNGRWHWLYVAWAPPKQGFSPWQSLGCELWASDAEGGHSGEASAHDAARAALHCYVPVWIDHAADWKAALPDRCG